MLIYYILILYVIYIIYTYISKNVYTHSHIHICMHTVTCSPMYAHTHNIIIIYVHKYTQTCAHMIYYYDFMHVIYYIINIVTSFIVG